MKTYEITCNAVALVKLTVRAGSVAEAMNLAEAQKEALPDHLTFGDTSATFVDWAIEGGAAEVSA